MMNESAIMMSSELLGLIPDLEDEVASSPISLTAIIVGVIRGQEAPCTGQLVGISSIDQPTVEMSIDIKTALEMFKNVANITFENIQVIYLETVVSLGGPFTISDIKIRDVNQTKRECILSFKLISKLGK